jgi:LCP family protein required for cell wall assembly
MKWMKILAILFTVTVTSAGGYAFYLYQSVKDATGDMYEAVEPSDLREEAVSIANGDPVSILIMGVDESGSDRGRTDSLVVLTVNPKTDSALMFNIPRDTRTEIVGRGVEDKINHAYAFGGVEMTMNTVEKFLNIPIDYYVRVDMEGFVQIIDTLDGVEVNNAFAFEYDGERFEEGPILLDGESALKYARMRYDDPRGDLGRNDRQRQVLKAVMEKSASPAILTKLHGILAHLGDSVKTNLQFDEIKTMAQDYRSAASRVETIEVKGTDAKMNGIYYFIVDPKERKRVSERMSQVLEWG